MKSICVYASSSDAVDEAYRVEARRLGELIDEHGHTLIYGGGSVGLMGVCARAVHARGGGHVTGVIPSKLVDLELAYHDSDELIVTETMSDRKRIMAEKADAFIALPGGFGTLEEIMEVLVLKQLWYHEKPCVFINIKGVYDHLFRFFDDLVTEHFIKDSHKSFFHVCATAREAYDYLLAYEPGPAHGKWF